MYTIAIFDLDGTLIPRPSAEARFAVHLLRLGRLSTSQAWRWLAGGTYESWRHGWRGWKRSKAYLAGTSVAEIEQAAERFVRDVLLEILRPSVLARLRGHQSTGNEVLLLSGAPDFLARPLCAHLGIVHCIATQCDTREGRFTMRPTRLHPFGLDKLALARNFCALRGARLDQAVAYGDSADDAPLLAAVGHAIAVHPDARLERLARLRSWDVVGGAGGVS